MTRDSKTTSFKCDIAISFLGRDCDLACKIADRLKESCSVFCYPRSQEDIAGTDGIETFKQAFGFDSRLVLVLHREDWGLTPWTRVESEVIKERSLKEGWDFALIAKLQSNAKLPMGFPESRIYIDFEQYGFDQTIGAVLASLERQEGVLKIETALDRAARLANDNQFRQERENLLHSDSGVEAASILLKALFSSVSNRCIEVQAALADYQLSCTCDPEFLVLRVHCRDAVSLGVQWNLYASNWLDNSELVVGEVHGLLATRGESGQGYVNIESPKTLRKHQFVVDYSRSREWGWKEKKRNGRTFTTVEMSEHIIKLFLNLIDRVSKGELKYAIK